MLNYINTRLEEFSAEIKNTTDLPSANEPSRRPTVVEHDLASIDKIGQQASAIGEDLKKKASPFPQKKFQMRSSILTELLEVSHIRSIRQIFIAILVILVLQVAITDLFEQGA